jgi:hypothetical protein
MPVSFSYFLIEIEQPYSRIATIFLNQDIVLQTAAEKSTIVVNF